VTATTTIGASRQKQILRVAGALIGGVVLGIGAQVFILPHLDSITAFTVLFLVVTIPAAWIITSSPRLSYFGAQIAIAFYLINLQEFKFQTSLEVARDRVIGIVLGLTMMWLAFDHLWAVPAIVEMKRVFISAIRSLAQFLREPRPGELQPEIERTLALRETINSQLDQIRSQADAVLFEFGSAREQALALRSRIVSCSPQLRTLFVIQTALVKYRFRQPGFELPDTIHAALREFDERMAAKLESIADRMEGEIPAEEIDLMESRNRLGEAIRDYSQGRLQTLSSLLQTEVGLITSFDRDSSESG
jgi:multidrug resistance protein MdtO